MCVTWLLTHPDHTHWHSPRPKLFDKSTLGPFFIVRKLFSLQKERQQKKKLISCLYGIVLLPADAVGKFNMLSFAVRMAAICLENIEFLLKDIG